MVETWKDIPELTLLRIFRCLNIEERKNASLTCKNWYKIINSPSLWRSVFCMFKPQNFRHPSDDHPNAVELTKCLPLVRHCAPWIQELTIFFYGNTKEDDKILDTMKTFVESLIDSVSDMQLKKFTLDIDYNPTDEGQILENILLSLTKFLRRQNRLISFGGIWEMHEIYCGFLNTLSSYSSTTLKVLEIRHHYPKRFDGLYSSSLSTLRQLQYVTLPYEVLGEDSITVLADNCQFLTLLTLSIEICLGMKLETDNLVSEDTWKKVSEKLPQLGVAIEIGYFGIYAVSILEYLQDLNIILPSTIPLIGVKCSWYSLNPEIMNYLHKFKDHIRSLDFKCVDHLDTAMNLINSCPNLSMLKFITKLSRDTVEKLTNLNIREFRDLKRFTLLLELDEELQEREREIEENYRSLWRSNRYYIDIYSNPFEDIYNYLCKENFCFELYPAI